MKNDKPMQAAKALMVDFDTRHWFTAQDVERGKLAWADIIRRELQWEKVQELCRLTLVEGRGFLLGLDARRRLASELREEE